MEEEQEHNNSESEDLRHLSFLGFERFFRQTAALLWKNFLERKRNPWITLCELFSPLVIICLLWYAFSLSDVFHIPEPWYTIYRKLRWRGVGIIPTLYYSEVPMNPKACGTLLKKAKYAEVHLNITESLLDGLLGNYYQELPEAACSSEIALCHQTEDRQKQWGDSLDHPMSFKETMECLEDLPANELSWRCRAAVEEAAAQPQVGGLKRLREFRDAAEGLLEGPLRVPSLDQFAALGRFLSAPLRDNQRAQVLRENDFGREYGNLLTLGRLHVVPAGPVADDLISHLKENNEVLNDPARPVAIMTHESEAEALAFVEGHLEERTWAVVVLGAPLLRLGRRRRLAPSSSSSSSSSSSPSPAGPRRREEEEEGGGGGAVGVEYTLRMNYTTLPNTYEAVDWVALGLDPRYQRYLFSGFLPLQRAVDAWALPLRLPPNGGGGGGEGEEGEKEEGACAPPLSPLAGAALVPFPTPKYDQNLFYTAVGYLLGLAMAMATLFPLSRTVKGLVEERESGLAEQLQASGLAPAALFSAQLLTAALVFTWVAVETSVVVTSSFLRNSSPSLIFAYLWVFCQSEAAFGLALGRLFARARLAAAAAPAALFAAVLPRYIFYGSNRYEATRSKYFAALLSPTAFTFGADVLADYEYAGKGLTWGNMDEGGGFTFGTSFRMMILDTFIYTFLNLYLNQIVPKRGVGSGKHPLFFLGIEWGGSLNGWLGVYKQPPWRAVSSENAFDYLLESDSAINSTNVEPVPPELGGQARVRLRALVKTYPGGKQAVRGLSLDLHEGQLTCLLGHNGAGKSTTIGMLTGVHQPTKGDCVIYGKSIKHNLQAARQLMGVCPQTNVIIPWMTVEEHLVLYGLIKGVPRSRRAALAVAGAEEVGLGEKLRAPAAALSGGTKRKLCVACAFVGDPRFVLLDEPTAGMDPCSRRRTWELLRRRARGGRCCVLLTTHYMDEADFLAERIAILSQGKLTCCGSSLFLKSRFGVGYTLTVVTVPPPPPAGAGAGGAALPKEDDELDAVVRSHVPEAELLSRAARERAYRLPAAAAAAFPALLARLDHGGGGGGGGGGGALGVQGWGISVTTLEEVFLRLGVEAATTWGGDASNRKDEGNYAETDLPQKGNSRTNLFAKTGTDMQRLGQHVHGSPISSYDMRPMEGLAVPATDQEQGIEMTTFQVAPAPTSPMAATRERDRSKEDEQKLGSPHALLGDRQRSASAVSAPPGPSEGGQGRWQRQWRMGAVQGAGFGTQFWHLLLKRWHIAKRDWKGLFFQVIFPALQVLLVLAILTVEPKIAGPPIALTPRLFGEGAVTLVSPAGPRAADLVATAGRGQGSSGALGYTTTQQEWMVAPAGVKNSSEMSDLLLHRPESQALHEEDFYGAINFDDSIEVKFEIDYPAIAERLEPLLDLAARSSPKGEISLSNVFGDLFNYTVSDFDISPGRIVQSYIQSLNQTKQLDSDNINFVAEIVSNILNSSWTEAVDQITGFKQLESIADGLLRNCSQLQLCKDLVGNSTEPLEALISVLSGMNSTEISNILVGLGMESQDANILARDISYETKIAGMDEIAIITEFLQGLEQANATVLDDMEISFDDAVYRGNSTDDVVEIKNLALKLGNRTYKFGHLGFHLHDVKKALPKQTVKYTKDWHPTATVMHNTSSPHAIAVFASTLTMASAQACSESEPLVYRVINHPLPLTARQSLEVQTVLSLFASLFLLIPLCYIPAAFAPFYVMERIRKVRHLQAVSGVSCAAYWCAALAWDLGLCAALAALTLAALRAHGAAAAEVFMSAPAAAGATALLLLAHAAAALPLTYLYARRFRGPATAQIAIAGAHFFTGFVAVLGYFILHEIPKTRHLAGVLVHFFRFFPTYNMGDGLVRISAAFYRINIMGEPISQFDWDIAGRPLVLMAAESLGYFALVIFLDKGYVQALGTRAKRICRPKTLASPYFQEVEDLDEDVLQETQRAADCRDPRAWAVLARRLYKTYPARASGGRPKTAVAGLSLAVPPGECFGLLGVNGAGKTTALGLLTGELAPSAGEAYVGGRALADPRARRLVGYCPQVDPLLDLLTAEETLRFFAAVKGVPAARRAGEAARLLARVGLAEHAGVCAGRLSGGNKRKLSLAAALVGDPPVLLLDEPSSGMDPAARRKMWSIIQQVARERAVVLTTHSMEECEALCGRVGLLAAGRLRCLGAPQHLKNRFGRGYQLELKCSGAKLAEVQDFVFSAFPGTTLEEINGPKMKYRLGRVQSSSLPNVFAQIEMWKGTLEIEEYAVSQCSLEQIFIAFAREQEQMDENKAPDNDFLPSQYLGVQHESALV